MENCLGFLLITTMNSKDFKRKFGEIAKSKGFDYAFGGWFKEGVESIIILDLQKSNFGNYYELNIKIYLQGIFGKKYSMSKNLVKSDTGDIFRRQPFEFSPALDFDKSIDDEKRQKYIESLFDAFLIPFTHKALSRSGLRELAEKQKSRYCPPSKRS
jgi:hypothetical protein